MSGTRGAAVAVLLLMAAAALQGVARHAAAPPPSHVPNFEEMVKLRWVTDVSLSPDGEVVAFVVSQAPSPSFTSNTEIWIAAAEEGRPAVDGPLSTIDHRPSTTVPHRLLSGSSTESEPRWSPDGTRLAFIATRDAAPQVYLADRDGTAERAVPGSAGATSIRWSPDGRYLSALARRRGGAGQKKGDEPTLASAPAPFARLAIVDVATGQPRIVSGNVPVGVYAWAPDSRRLAFVEPPYLGRTSSIAGLFVASVDGGEPREIARMHDPTFGLDWSPDGRTIACNGRDHAPKSTELMVYDPDAPGLQTGRPIGAGFPGNVLDIAFLPSGKLALAALQGSRIGLFSIGLDGTPPVTVLAPGTSKPGTLGGGSRSVLSFSADRRRVAMVHSGPAEPGNVVVGEWGSKPLEARTDLNPQVRQFALGETQDITWKAKDGTEIGGLLIRPVGYTPGQRYPAVVEMHGGPRGAFMDNCQLGSSWGQLLATHGYMVLLPNSRGSVGRGSDFVRALNRDAGGVEYTDMVAGVDHLIRLGYADPDRLGVAGWSWGGYMTLWTVTQTARFKAAVAGEPISNLFEAEAENGSRTNISASIWQEPGIAYRNPHALLDRSPIVSIRNVRTPTLLLRGTQGLPANQSDQFYYGLKALGVTTELVTYPGELHVFVGEAHRIDVLRRVVEWFDRYLKTGAHQLPS